MLVFTCRFAVIWIQCKKVNRKCYLDSASNFRLKKTKSAYVGSYRNFVEKNQNDVVVSPKFKSIARGKKTRISYELRMAQCIKLTLWHPDSSIFFSSALTTLNYTYQWKSASSLLITSYSFLHLLGRIHHIDMDRFFHSHFPPCSMTKCMESIQQLFALASVVCREQRILLSCSRPVHICTLNSMVCTRTVPHFWQAELLPGFILHNYKETAFN